MYELAKNQNAQSKLRSEILTISKNSGKEEVTYEDLSKMKYADMCITGKKWPCCAFITTYPIAFKLNIKFKTV